MKKIKYVGPFAEVLFNEISFKRGESVEVPASVAETLLSHEKSPFVSCDTAEPVEAPARASKKG